MCVKANSGDWQNIWHGIWECFKEFETSAGLLQGLRSVGLTFWHLKIKRVLVPCSKALLGVCDASNPGCLDEIITGDEIQVHFCEPTSERKAQKKAWVLKCGNSHWNARRNWSEKKVFYTVFFSRKRWPAKTTWRWEEHYEHLLQRLKCPKWLTLSALRPCSQCSHCNPVGFSSEAENVCCVIQSVISGQLLRLGPWNLVH